MNKKCAFLLFTIYLVFNISQTIFSESAIEPVEIHLAVVGPMDSDEDVGTTFVRAAQLFVDQNEQSAIRDQYKIVLHFYNDQNDEEIARLKANEIASNNQILGVIGHYYSSVSMIGGAIYKEKGIPAVTPTATSLAVTSDNDWYFRTVFNDLYQGEFLANYAKSILKRNQVTIISEDQAYGSGLAQIFEATSQKNGMQINQQKLFRVKSSTLEADLVEIISKIKEKNLNELIFLACHYQEGIRIIKLLKDAGLENQILTPDAFAHPGFANGFSIYPKENGKPGYYSNNVYVAVPLLYQSSNFRAREFYEAYLERYGVEPDWRAAYAYDAALLFSTAVKNSGILQNTKSIIENRKAVRDYFGRMTSPIHGIEGVTGLTFFDKNGTSPKPVTLGQYKNRLLVPALTQLHPVADIKSIPNLEQALQDELIVKVGSEYMHKTNIIYTGVHINSIKDVDLDNLTYTLNFDLWFRYLGDSNISDIDFLNAAAPVKLRMPTEEIRMNNELYRRYNVVGRFKGDFILPENAGKHVLGVSFSHKSVPRKNLIFVPDLIGGDLISYDISREDQMIISESGTNWTISKIWSFQDVNPRRILGNSKYLNNISKKVNYSSFISAVEVKDDVLTFRNSLTSIRLAYFLLGLSLVLGILFQSKIQLFYGLTSVVFNFVLSIICREKESNSKRPVIRKKSGFSYYLPKDEIKSTSEHKTERRKYRSPGLFWFFTAVSQILFLYSVEIIVIRLSFGRMENSSFQMIIFVFDILWWIIPTHNISLALKTFVWDYLKAKSGHEVPTFLRGFFTFILYFLMFFGILAFVYDQKVTSILGTSGIFVMIFGLAVQMNISNIFAGLVLNTERSIRVGDWVEIEKLEEGQVVEVNWRTTKIRARSGTFLNVPNNTISESNFKNFTTPNNVIKSNFFIDVDKNEPFDKIKKYLLCAAQRVEELKNDPAISVTFDGFTHWSAKYKVFYIVDDYAKKLAVRGRLWEEILKEFRARKIRSASMMMNYNDNDIFEDS